MGIVNFDTDVTKTVEITKVVNLDVDKTVTSIVNLTGNLATAEASADAVGVTSPIFDGFDLVDTAGGLTREELHGEWWERALNVPNDLGPDGTSLPTYFAPDGSLQGLDQDVQGVFFVDGSSGGEIMRSFAVPYGETLAFPLVNVGFIVGSLDEDIDPANGIPDIEETEPDFESLDPESLFLRVDGEDVLPEDPIVLRAQTGVVEIPIQEGGFLDAAFPDDPDDTLYGEFDGYFVLLEGLSPGLHTIEFGGAGEGLAPDTTVEILVVAEQALAEGALAETDTFAQVTPEGAFSFSESLAALSFASVDDFVF